MTDTLGIEKTVKDALPESVKNPAAAWQKIAARMLYSYRQQFLTGGYGHWMMAKHQTGGKLMMKSMALYESATTATGDNYAQLNWGFGLPSARMHQVGGSIPVTAKSRKFFWAQWFQTRDEFWKKMALTKKGSFSVPARPIVLTEEDYDFIANTLGTRDFKITTNFGASIIPRGITN